MSDDIGRRLRAARPETTADGWTDSADGHRALAAIRRAADDAPSGSGLRMRLLLPARGRGRSIAYGLGAAVVAAAAAMSFAGSGAVNSGTPPMRDGAPPAFSVPGPRPQDLALAAYTDCPAMLAGLRDQTAAHVGAAGLSGASPSNLYDMKNVLPAGPSSAGAPNAGPLNAARPAITSADQTAPNHSTTNDQESGADEPDLVKTDGNRVVSVSGGVLRVVDPSTREVTGSLDLTMYSGADAAQLLVSGNRALVILGDGGAQGMPTVADRRYPTVGTGTAYLLVDLAPRPTIVNTLHPKGSYVDARMVGGIVRLVVRSSPTISFPVPGERTNQRSAAENKVITRRAPLSAWLPSYEVTTGGGTTTHAVSCPQVRHPASYTGTSMLTVYTIDPSKGFADLSPVSLAADGSTVYATASSLYVASESAAANGGEVTTDLHRFDITGAGRPTYLGSGAVPGRLLSSYSLSDYDGHLRVVTTTGGDTGTASSAVYVLDARTLKQTGHVGGLGPRERVYAVRFLGALAYVVTYRSVDPLYVLDLRDPGRPRKAGELQMTGYSGYLHPTGSDRLLGVGNAVGADNEPTGIQISLFDVGRPSHPLRLDRLIQRHTPGSDALDPHVFLYWSATGTAVVPIQTWNPAQAGTVLVLHVGRNDLRTLGTIRNPTTTAQDGSGIQRTLVIGGAIWTISADGIAISDASTLHRRAWIPFA